MAAILAEDDQICFCPSFATGRFTPYMPWRDRFWERFGRMREEDRSLVAIREDIFELRQARADLERHNSELRKTGEKQRSKIVRLEDKIAAAQTELATSQQELATSQQKLNSVKHQINAMQNSRSWRLTEPARRLRRLFETH